MDVAAFDPEELKDDSPVKKGVDKRRTVELDPSQSAILLAEKSRPARLASDDFNIGKPKGRYILTKSQRERWNKIIQHVPHEYRVYI